MNCSTTFEPPAALLREHMPIVHRVVAQLGRRLPRSVPREDLIAAGTLGLYQALKKGTPDCPAMFAAYASARIRGAILDELRRLDWFPRRRGGAAAPDHADRDASVAGAPPEDGARRARQETAEPPRRARRSERTLVCIDDVEIDSPIPAESGTPGDHFEGKEALLSLRTALDALPEREREVIEMRYFRGMTGKAVAFALGLSEARVSQLHARAIELLRRKVEGEAALLFAA